MTRTEQLRKMTEEYVAGMPADADKRFTIGEIAEWAVRTKRYRPDSKQAIKLCTSDLRHALERADHVDPQGRHVRTWVCASQEITDGDGRPKQQWLWRDMREAPYEFVLSAFQQMQKGIAKDVKRLRDLQDSYNENYRPKNKRPIRLLFDFTIEADAACTG